MVLSSLIELNLYWGSLVCFFFQFIGISMWFGAPRYNLYRSSSRVTRLIVRAPVLLVSSVTPEDVDYLSIQ